MASRQGGQGTGRSTAQIVGICLVVVCIFDLLLFALLDIASTFGWTSGDIVAAMAGFALAMVTSLLLVLHQARRPRTSDLPVPPSKELERTQAQAQARTPQGAEASAPSLLPDTTALTPAPRATSHFDYEGLVSTLTSTDDPLATLKVVVGQERTREGQIERGEAPDDMPAPSGLELYLARALEEAGLFSDDVEIPPVHVVIPHRSGLFYLRVDGDSLPYLAKLRIIQIEGALNRTHFAYAVLPDPDSTTMEQAYVLNAQLMHSICAQLPEDGSPAGVRADTKGEVSVEAPAQDVDPNDSEWVVRQAIAVGIETFQLPFRLTADYRVNMSEGNVAVSIDLVPPEVFPASAYSEALGRVIPTTSSMRSRVCADYALRCGLLVAKHVLRCSTRVRHVFVAGVLDTATTHSCLYSVDFDREGFDKVDLSSIDDPVATFRSFGATMDYRDDALLPVTQSFSLEDERFCPARRYDSVDLSQRPLTGTIARRLGASHVCDLAIHEEARREELADDIARDIGPSTEKNVRLILDLVANDPDSTVQEAARRTVGKLIEGTIPESNPIAVSEDFVDGDELTQQVDRASDLLENHKPQAALDALVPHMTTIDDARTYDDADGVRWHSFSSYAGRALFNRMHPEQAGLVRLVPDSYYEAHQVLSTALLACDREEEALAHAERCVGLDPLDSRGYLRMTRCHEEVKDYASAIADLMDLLRIAHDPEAVGVAYYRLAFMEWRSANVLCARACYKKSLEFHSSCSGLALVELRTLEMASASDVDETSGEGDVDAILLAHGIPLAPTREITEALMECAQASLDAEVFPVARNFTTLLGALTGDDVMVDVMRSIENEPDR